MFLKKNNNNKYNNINKKKKKKNIYSVTVPRKISGPKRMVAGAIYVQADKL